MTIFLTLAAFALVVFYVYLLSVHVDWGLVSLLVAELFHIAFGPTSQVLGGIHLDPLDAVSLCLLAAGIIRTFRTLKSINLTRFLAVAYLLLVAVSLARGFYANGILAAANESRSFVGPIVAALYFLTAPTDRTSVRRYIMSYLYFGAALAAVATLAAAGLPLGMNAWADSSSVAVDGRYLPATGAAALAVCGFISLAWNRYQKTGLLYQVVPVMFVATAIYLRHRTVWVMILAGALALPLIDARLFRRLLPAALVATVAVAVLAIYGSTADGLAGTTQFSESATSSQTLQWRLNGWKELLFDDDQNALTVSLGKSMGSGFWRIDPVSDRYVGVAPHSEYIQEYLRVGVLGTVFMFFFAIRPLSRLWRISKLDPTAVYPSASAWGIIVFMTLVYGVTYGIEPHAYALIGIANAIALKVHAPAAEPQQDFAEDWSLEALPSFAE